MYKPVVGLVLLYSAYRTDCWERGQNGVTQPPLLPVAASGAGISMLSGLTGVGGGIFLSPLLLFAGWAETRQSI
ncbi:TSUP family transporter [Chitinibacter mangrovi]|uniref:TSUP family transporter n=1 Tax=Chitinibacter mangrovi TaxID=3153927 RepID=UPI003D816D4E